MDGIKTFSEIYLPAEEQLTNQLVGMIQDTIRSEKKIRYLDPNKNGQEHFLEYFIVTEAEISFKRRNGDKKKDKVSAKELRDAIKYALRTDEELTRQSFAKMYGTVLGTSLYSLIDLLVDEIKKRKVVGQELSHQSFGTGEVSKLELQRDYLWFKFGDDLKMLSMDHFSLVKEDQQSLKNLLTSA